MIGRVQPHPEWRPVVEALKDREYGAVISHEEMAAIAGLPAQSRRYFAQVNKARRVLRRDWYRVLESEPSKGYRLVTPSEHHGCSRRQMRLMARRGRVAVDIVHATPQHLVSDAENVANANLLAKVGAVQAHLKNALKETRPVALPAKPDMPKLLNA